MPLVAIWLSFQLKNPRKGTETANGLLLPKKKGSLSIKESPEGDWNKLSFEYMIKSLSVLSIKESPEGDWNLQPADWQMHNWGPFN